LPDAPSGRNLLGASFEVRWDDGHRTGFRPAAGSARIVHAKKPRKR
jgi:hypothetical protein